MDIKAISVLLERFGPLTSYNVYLDIYNSDIHGQTNGIHPIATLSKSAEDINNYGWYNFALTNAISTSSEYILVVMRQEYVDNENFISWVHSNIDTENLNLTGYAIDNLQSVIGSEFYGNVYFYGYGYGGNISSIYDYFDILDIDGIEIGYNLETNPYDIYGYGYGYELVPLSIFNTFTRCIKVYSGFNDITQDASGALISLPEKETNSITLSGRQDFINTYKNNVEVLNDHITLKGIGKRLGFIDRRDLNLELTSSNIGLPPIVTCFDVSEGSDEYNCLCLCGSELDGLYKSINSGASWTKITTFPSNNIKSVKISPNTNLFAVASKLSTSELYISEDQGATWNTAVSITGNSTVIDMVWYNNDILYLSTETQGVLKYVVSTNTQTSFNTGLTGSLPTGRRLFIDHANDATLFDYGYGYGHGYGLGMDYFDVLDLSSSFVGYGANGFEELYDWEYGWGYGYEFFSYTRLYWATDNGLYVNDMYFDWFRIGEDYSIDDCYSVLAIDNIIYVGIDTGIALSLDYGLTFSGHLATDETKFRGLLLQPVLALGYDSTNSIIYTGQEGQISYSYGNLFKQVTNDFSYDNDIVDFIINPNNPDIIHVLTRNNIGNTVYFTYLIDNSDSLLYLDPTNKRRTIVDEINDEMISSDRKYIAQIIQFSGLQTNTSKTSDMNLWDIVNNTLYSKKQIEDLTGGFLRPINSTDLDEYINLIGTNDNSNNVYYSPLIDALYMSIKSVVTGGFEWEDNDSNDLKYNILSNSEPEIYESENVLVIATDCNNGDSLREIADFVNDSKLKNKIRFKVYIIVIGSDFNKEILNILNKYFKKSEIFICYSNTDVDNAITYIKNKEANNVTEGVIRKQLLLSDNYSSVTSVNVEIKLPQYSYAKFRFRFSNNNDDLLNESFSEYTDLADGSNTVTLRDIVCKYFEFEIYLKKEKLNSFPSLSSVTINYDTCSLSKIVFNKTDYETEKIEQILLTRNIFSNEFYIPSVGYGYGYIYDYQDEVYGYGLSPLPYLDDYWYFSESNAWTDDVSEKIREERVSYTKRRIKEPTTTIDYYIYTLSNGPWSKDREIIVYKNDLEVNSKDFNGNPNNGTIRFHQQLKQNDVITITVSPSTNKRFFTNIYNALSNKDVLLKDFVVEYLPETRNRTYKLPLPTFASQTIYDIAIFMDYYNISPQNSRTINATYVISKSLIESNRTKNIDPGDYVYFTLGELLTYLDEDLEDSGVYDLLPHQNSWIFGDFNETTRNQLSLISSNRLSSFRLEQKTDNGYQYALFQTQSTSVLPTENLTLTIGDTSTATNGFDFRINQDSETGHIVSEVDGNTGGLSTYVWMGFGAEDENISGEIEYSHLPLRTSISNSGIELRVINDVTPDNREVEITVQIIDKNGNLYVNYTSDLFKDTTGYISLYYKSYAFQDANITRTSESVTTQQLITDIKIEPSNLGQISYTFSVPDGVTVIVAVLSALAISADGPPIVFHNNIAFNSKLYFGDLNMRSAVSIGRQSPDYIYQYARDIGKLDFCSIADDLDKITIEPDRNRYLQIQRKANKYNVENQFITFSGFRIVPYNYNTANIYYGARTIIVKDLVVDGLATKPNLTTGIESFFTDLTDKQYICMLQTTPYLRSPNYGKKYNFNVYSNSDFINSSIVNCDNAFEVYSEHGQTVSFETSSTIGLTSAEPSNGYYFLGALCSKKTMVVLANSNSDIGRPGWYNGELERQESFPTYNNRGITGVWASSLSRANIFDSIKDGRRTFASTGMRGLLDFKIKPKTSGQTLLMGSQETITREILSGGIDVTINCIQNQDVTMRLYRLDVKNPIELKSPTLISSVSMPFETPTLNTTITDNTLSALATNITRVCYYVEVEFGSASKHRFWSTPIYIDIS